MYRIRSIGARFATTRTEICWDVIVGRVAYSEVAGGAELEGLQPESRYGAHKSELEIRPCQRVPKSPLYCHAKGKRHINTRLMPNSPLRNIHSYGSLWTFSLELFRYCSLNYGWHSRKNSEENSPKFPCWSVFNEREFGNVWGMIREFSARPWLPCTPVPVPLAGPCTHLIHSSGNSDILRFRLIYDLETISVEMSPETWREAAPSPDAPWNDPTELPC